MVPPKVVVVVSACLAVTGDVTFTQEPIRLKVRGLAYIVGDPEGL